MTITGTNPGNTFDTMSNDDCWLGFGYLGERRIHLSDHGDPESPPLTDRQATVADVDARVLAHATRQGWTYDDLFTWANSSNGRHFADAAFGGAGFDQAARWGLLALPAR